jgi:abortive infection bacteriophage resistance protein
MTPSSHKITYSKPFLTLQEQIDQLKARGMQFEDEEKASEYLANLNYYRLSAYWLPFEKDHATHQFHDGTQFDRIIELYVFDRELRLLMLDAIERIEVSVRSRLAYELSQVYGSHVHMNADVFHPADTYAKTFSKLKSEIDRGKEPFLKHFNDKYEEELPPIWASVELMTMGQVSNWFSCIKRRKDKQRIAKHYALDEKVLGSFLHHLTIIRNICAHHSALWNKNLTVELRIPSKFQDRYNLEERRKLFNTLVMTEHLMGIISPKSSWYQRVEELIEKYSIDTTMMGYKL